MAFQFQVSAGSATPIFKQIVDQVRLASVTGRLIPGAQLPSVRALAEQLLINPNTIAKAYTELARLGIIQTHQGRGVFVAQPRQIYTKSERVRRIEPLIQSLAKEGVALGFARAELVESLEEELDKLGLATVAQARAGAQNER